MAKRKTEFRLRHENGPSSWWVKIDTTGLKPKVVFYNDDMAPSMLSPEETELFALNILKALKSKHLKQKQYGKEV